MKSLYLKNIIRALIGGSLLVTPLVNAEETKKESCEDSACAIVKAPSAMNNDAQVFSKGFDSFDISRLIDANTEMLLPAEELIFWGLDRVNTPLLSKGKTIIVEKEISELQTVASKESVKNIGFRSGLHQIDDKFVENLKTTIKRLGHLKNLRLHFIGHTDNQPLSARSSKIYTDNYGLGRFRAERTANFFKEKLGLSKQQTSFEGKGADQPLGSNDKPEGMALNRRVEIQIWYDQVVTRTVEESLFLPATNVTRTSICREKPLCQTVETINKFKRVTLKNTVKPIRFKVAQSTISDEFIAELREVTDQLKDKKELQLTFIGHTDSQALSASLQKTYADNQVLSVARAKRVARYFYTKIGFDNIKITSEGKGFSEPVDSNDTAQGRSLNRRVEVEVSYLVPDGINTITGDMQACPSGQLPDNMSIVSNGAALAEPFKMTPWRVSIDGNPVNDAYDRHTADVQRCTDVALEKADIQLHYDRLQTDPALSLSHWPKIAVTGQALNFRAWSNYPHWIKRSEVEIFTRGFDGRKQVIDTLTLNKDLNTQWTVPEVTASELWFRLKTFNDLGHIDSTQAIRITTSEDFITLRPNDTEEEQQALAVQKERALNAGYGENQLAQQSIPIEGGTITVNGHDIPKDKQVWVMGQAANVDKNGYFVTQQIIPLGLHTAEVAVLDEQGNGELLWRDLQFKQSEWFTVGIADLTFSFNDTNGSTDLVNGSTLEDGSSEVGRLAFYTKGHLDNGDLVTVSVDTKEQPLNELFKNNVGNDPVSILRRLDAEDYYPTFGDDSNLIEDAPTQGKIYAKIERGNDFAMWGNYQLKLKDNELTQIQRSLYGLQLQHRSDEQHNEDDRTTVDIFAATPETVSSREIFNATGGSLYYLRHRDLTNGSEQVNLEVRDRDTGIVVSSQQLVAGTDYELDEIQGILILSKPLSLTSNDTQVVQSTGIAGQPNVLVVNYEYFPSVGDSDARSIGGQVSHWFNDSVQLSVTISNQDQSSNKQKLGGADLLFQHSDNNWIKLSVAQSSGAGFSEQSSLDGGFDFNASSLAVNNEKANAYRIESAFTLDELGLALPIRGHIFRQERDANFAAPGLQTNADSSETILTLNAHLADATELQWRHSENEKEGGIKKQADDLEIKQSLNDHWAIKAGLRHERQTDKSNANQTNQGKRNDLALRAEYDSLHQWSGYGFVQDTVSKGSNRQDNQRIGVGVGYKPEDHIQINAEISNGDLGSAVSAGLDYQYSDDTSFYLNYALDSDNSGTTLNQQALTGEQSTLIAGGRTRFSDSTSVYAEQKYTQGKQSTGLTQAYGIDWDQDDYWTYGFTYEHGDINSEVIGQADSQIKRQAIGFRLGYVDALSRYAGSFEFREDEGSNEDRDSRLMRNSYHYQTSDDWRFIGRLDIADSESSLGDEFNGEFVEAVIGYAWRPVDNERWNSLVKYTWLSDLSSPDQVDGNDNSFDFQQRSQVIAVDVNYDISHKWTIGGKFAHRRSELRDRAKTQDFFRSDAQLLVARADWHVVKKWDVLIEARSLKLKQAGDHKQGILIGAYRHFGEHFKVGVGYNFTDFSDDLTDLDYDSHGLFINLVGKI